MDYLLILILQLLGIGFHVGQKVNELDKKFPDDSLQDVFTQFWQSDRITVFISLLVMATNLVVHFIVHEYAPSVREWNMEGFGIVNYFTISFAIALLLGYFGQRKIYQWFGKAEQALDEKVDKILK